MLGTEPVALFIEKALPIRLLLTDCDGVLTDGGVYYSEQGEMLKRFSLRDGMGVERLRDLLGIETGILTGENSLIVARRAAKLGITELHLGAKNKHQSLLDLLTRRQLSAEQIAYIGDDLNDERVMRTVGFAACPADAMPGILRLADYICQTPGGHGAFREFAELIIQARTGALSASFFHSNGHTIQDNPLQ